MSQAVDLALMGLAATSQRVPLIALAILLIVVRRVPLVCRGLLSLPSGWPWYAAPWQPGPLALTLLPGLTGVMSRAPGDEAGSPLVLNQAEPAGTSTALADTNAERTSSAPIAADVGSFPTGHKLSAEDVLSLLAQHTDYSANQIAQLVGGKRADTLAAIARHRTPAPSATPATTLRRPAGGW